MRERGWKRREKRSISFTQFHPVFIPLSVKTGYDFQTWREPRKHIPETEGIYNFFRVLKLHLYARPQTPVVFYNAL